MLFSESYNKYIICEDGFENICVNGIKLGYKLKIRFPSYRGTQLSCINRLWVKVGGNPIKPQSILFCLNNKQFLMAQLPELNNEYWFILDDAELRVMKEGGLPEGDHEIEVGIEYKIPYTGYFGNYLNAAGSYKRKLLIK